MTKYVGREENEIKKRSGRKIKISFFIDCSIRRREDGILSSYTAGWFVVTIVVYNSGYSDVRIFQIFPGVQDYFFFSFFFLFRLSTPVRFISIEKKNNNNNSRPAAPEKYLQYYQQPPRMHLYICILPGHV
jgi:hypothetical protein